MLICRKCVRTSENKWARVSFLKPCKEGFCKNGSLNQIDLLLLLRSSFFFFPHVSCLFSFSGRISFEQDFFIALESEIQFVNERDELVVLLLLEVVKLDLRFQNFNQSLPYCVDLFSKSKEQISKNSNVKNCCHMYDCMKHGNSDTQNLTLYFRNLSEYACFTARHFSQLFVGMTCEPTDIVSPRNMTASRLRQAASRIEPGGNVAPFFCSYLGTLGVFIHKNGLSRAVTHIKHAFLSKNIIQIAKYYLW